MPRIGGPRVVAGIRPGVTPRLNKFIESGEERTPPPSALVNQPSETKALTAKAIIASVLGEDFGKGAHKRLGERINDFEDINNLMVATLLKYRTSEAKRFVNTERIRRGLQPIEIDKRDIYNFKRVYAGAIDKAYVAVGTYIGDLHPFADKIHRIGILNSIVENLEHVKEELLLADDFTLKKANLLIKALDRMNVEMGSVTMEKFLTPRNVLNDPDLEEEKPMSKQDIEKFFEMKYTDQLPINEAEILSPIENEKITEEQSPNQD